MPEYASSMRSSCSRPRVSASAIRSAHSGRPPRSVDAQLHQVLLRRHDEGVRGQLVGPSRRSRATSARVYGWWSGKVAEAAATRAARPASVRRNASGLPMPQNAATGRCVSRSSGSLAPIAVHQPQRAVDRSRRPASPGRAGRLRQRNAVERLWCDLIAAASAARASARAQAARRLAQQAAREAGGRGPRGRSRRSARRRGRGASRRCWKPSSRTSTSLSSSSTAGCGQGDAVGPLQVRHVGQVLLEDQRLVVAAGVGAVAAAQDGDAPLAAAIEAGDVLDARRLAGAADGQVADADDAGTDADRRRSQPRS